MASSTLYDLIAAISDEIEVDEEKLIVTVVSGLIDAGRLSWIRSFN